MKKSYFIILLMFFGTLPILMNGQENCKVLMADIEGEYIGGCKDGLAEGKGLSKGKHRYEGDFKKGLPHGNGKILYDDVHDPESKDN